MTKYFLSWDCANKSLAWSVMHFSGQNAIENVIISEVGVVDVLAGKKLKRTTHLQRTRLLRKFLEDNFGDSFIEKYGNISIIIERQPASLNSHSFAVSQQLLYYFADFDVMLISAKIKNEIELAIGKEYKKTYYDNKRRSRDNLDELLRQCGHNFSENSKNTLASIRHKYYSDIGDTIMQVIGGVNRGKIKLA